MDLVSILEVDATSLYVNRLCPETLLAVLVFYKFPFVPKKKKKITFLYILQGDIT